MNARELMSVAPAGAALPSSNPGFTSTLDLPAARSARDGLRSLLGAERTAAADFLLALADFDAHRGWEPLGHASLWSFLVAELGLSKGGASFRQAAARLVQRFPDVIVPLRDGRLCITTVFELSKVLTEQNLADVLPRFFGLSSAEAKEIVADLAPREAPPRRTVVTPVIEGARAPARFDAPAALPRASAELVVRIPSPEVQSTEPACPVRGPERSDDIEPLTADLRRLHVTVSRRFLKDLERAREGLSHAVPGATTEQVLRAALDLLLDKQARARGLVKRPRPVLQADETGEAPAAPTKVAALPPMEAHDFAEPPPPRRAGPRAAIPAAVRRAVWARDGDRCTWPLDGGGTCGSTHRLELDHVVPWARGGEATVGNLRVVCHAHNAVAARATFGARVTARYAAPA